MGVVYYWNAEICEIWLHPGQLLSYLSVLKDWKLVYCLKVCTGGRITWKNESYQFEMGKGTKKHCFNVCFSCWCDSIFNHFIILGSYFLQRHLPRISFCLVANIVWQLEAFLCSFPKLRNGLSMCEKFFAGTVNCLSLGCCIFNDC